MTERVPVEPDSSELREMLVAYLDGELDGESVRRVEELLVSDPRVERELRQLERAWDLLDRLPRAEVGPSFARSTVEMAAVAVEEELQPSSAGHGRRGALAAIVLLTAATAGFLGARLWPDANRQFLLDLPILENLEAYRQTPSIEFVRQLSDAELFADESVVATVPSGTAEGRLESLSPEQKEELHRDYERFIHLPADEQGRLRDLHAAIQAGGQSLQLDTTLARYQYWLEQLQGVERAELMALESEQRLARIQRMREDEARRLSPGDVQVFVDWFQAQLMQRLPPERSRELQQKLKGRLEPGRREVLGESLNKMRTGPGGPPNPAPLAGLAALLNKEPGAELRKELSPRGQQQFDRAQTLEDRFRLLQTWVRQAFWPPNMVRGMQLSLPQVSDEELKKFFETQLDPAERAHLLNLPADQMQRQLRFRYHQWKRGAAPGRGGGEKTSERDA
jgi:hypothetical protein